MNEITIISIIIFDDICIFDLIILKIFKKINVAYVGLKHGLFCLGCCWVLMLLLFVNGVMNLLWVVAITIIVLAEKMLPYEKLSSRFLGILLVGWGAYLIFI